MLAILGFLTGLAGPLATLASKVTDLKLERVKAESNEERARIDAEIMDAQARKAVLIAEAGQRVAGTLNACMRMALALGPALYILKYYAWDKVVGSFYGCAGLPRGVNPSYCKTFVTDPLNSDMAAVMTAVIAFYLIYDIAARYKKR